MKVTSNNNSDPVGRLFAPVAREFTSIGMVIALLLGAEESDMQILVANTGTEWQLSRATVTPATLAAAVAVSDTDIQLVSALPGGASKRYKWAAVKKGSETGSIQYDDGDNSALLDGNSNDVLLTLADLIQSVLAGTHDAGIVDANGANKSGFDGPSVTAIVVDQVAGHVWMLTDTTPAGTVIGDAIVSVGDSGNKWE